MAIGAFTDKAHQPTADEGVATLGPTRPLWARPVRLTTDSYRVQTHFTFYGKNHGWALRFRRGGKGLLSLYPGQGSFIAQIILSQAQADEASSLDLSTKVKRTIEEAHPYPKGRWLFIKVESEQDLSDIQQPLTVKSPPAQLKKETIERRGRN